MLSKILHGQFSLAKTFWKYGFMSLFLQTFVLYLLRVILLHKLGGVTLVNYYKMSLASINIEPLTFALTIGYLLLLAFFVFYTIILVIGIWRSSAEYERSIWLRHIARIFILLFVFFAYKAVF